MLKRRKIIFICLSLLIGTVVGALFAELVLRLKYKVPLVTAPIGSIMNDPEIGVVNKPGYKGLFRTSANITSVSINEQGLRDHAREYEKPPDTNRILALGDSYVWGHGVEYKELFLTVAESQMNEFLSKKMEKVTVDVVKAGVGGWGPENAYRYLIKEGLRYEPDVVMLCFFTGNDFFDSLNPDQYVEYRGMRLLKTSRDNISSLKQIHLVGRKHSLLYGSVSDLGKWLLKGRKNPYPEDLFFLQNCNNSKAEDRKKSRESTFRIIDKFRQWCHDSNVSFRVLVFSSRIEIDKAWRNKVISKYNLNSNDFDFDLPTRDICDYLSRQKIQYYTILEQSRELSLNGVPIHLVLDSHYSKELHRELGKYLAEQLITTM